MDKITVAQIQSERQAISKLHNEREVRRKKHDIEKWQVEREYRDKIWELEQQKREAINKIEDTQKTVIAQYDQQIEGHHQVVATAHRILECLSLDKSADLTIADDGIEISKWVTPHCESLGYLFDDDYLKIKVFIVGNRKPKNQYSLIAMGKSIFTEDLIKYRHDYGIDVINSYRGFSVVVSIKDMATIAELKDYYDKHKGKLLTDIVDEYHEVKAEYLEVIGNYNVKDFQELITWTCPKCDKFHTIFDDFSVNYTPQCFRHEPYIDMVKVNSKQPVA